MLALLVLGASGLPVDAQSWLGSPDHIAWQRTARVCLAKVQTLDGALEMFSLDHEVPREALVYDATLITYLYRMGYLDGGDDDCPSTRSWRDYWLSGDGMECRIHGNKKRPRARDSALPERLVPPLRPVAGVTPPEHYFGSSHNRYLYQAAALLGPMAPRREQFDLAVRLARETEPDSPGETEVHVVAARWYLDAEKWNEPSGVSGTDAWKGIQHLEAALAVAPPDPASELWSEVTPRLLTGYSAWGGLKEPVPPAHGLLGPSGTRSLLATLERWQATASPDSAALIGTRVRQLKSTSK